MSGLEALPLLFWYLLVRRFAIKEGACRAQLSSLEGLKRKLSILSVLSI